jgi:HPt (histidine-containing phosphotransfer) domain-containing protein
MITKINTFNLGLNRKVMAKIDLSYLKDITDGNTEIMLEMVDLILEQTPVHIQELLNHLENKDWKKLGAEAHKVKPLFSYVGLTDLKELSQQIEDSGKKEKNLDQLPELIDELKTEFNDVKQQLVEERESLT